MNLELTILILFVLFVTFIAYQAYIQLKMNAEKNKKRLSEAHSIIIDEAEDLLSHVSYIPYSKTLLYCLHNKIITEQERLLEVNEDDKNLLSDIAFRREQIENIQNNKVTFSQMEFTVPCTENISLHVVKKIKRMEDIVKSEYCKGVINLNEYKIEKKRLYMMKVKINTTISLKRSKDFLRYHQYQDSIDLLNKLIQILDAEDDPYSKKKIKDIENVLTEVMNKKVKFEEEDKANQKVKNKNEKIKLIFGKEA